MAILVKVHFCDQLRSTTVPDKNLFDAIEKALKQATFPEDFSTKEDIAIHRTLDANNHRMSIEITFQATHAPYMQGDTEKIASSLQQSFPNFLKKEFVFFHKTAY